MYSDPVALLQYYSTQGDCRLDSDSTHSTQFYWIRLIRLILTRSFTKHIHAILLVQCTRTRSTCSTTDMEGGQHNKSLLSAQVEVLLVDC
jgi:hypothetical protein